MNPLVTGERQTLHPCFKRIERRILATTNLSASHLCLGRSWNAEVLLEAVIRLTKDKDMIRDNQHSFTKGKSCLANSALYDGNDCISGQELWMSSIWTSVRPLTHFPTNIPLAKLEKYGVNG